ncbi:hypothetical protein BV898_18439 [Hypsibius exemplaris]|uniref:DRBM domain-containing protein n=1 Tax=Hypsibius exemplaris TaxID=2072580 RepID=A0A9X6NJQ2_HYPEX|nr:hypothetical protein BV898_18439 [Hypsibius exemplaris]
MANRILSYVAALADVCERDNIIPTYDLVRVEGPCHDPVFVIRGVADKFHAEGTGQKKQTAKQQAAKQILLAMGELSVEDLRMVESTAGFETAKVIGNVVDDCDYNGFRARPGAVPIDDGKEKRRKAYTPVPVSNQINPLGDLIETSTLMGWPHPRIVDEQKTGPAHDPRFTVSCYFSKFKTFATSRSKKEAKRLAALEMHENMRYQPDIMYKYSMRTGRPMNYSAVFAESIEARDMEAFATPSDFCYSGVPQILAIAQSHSIEMLQQIQSVDEIANPETVLQNVIKECLFEMHFEVLCEDLVCRPADALTDENAQAPEAHIQPPLMLCGQSAKPCVGTVGEDDCSADRKEEANSSVASKSMFTMYCVLRLPIKMPIRLLGFGLTLEDARYSAARNALHYIRLMSLKDC